VQPFLFFSDLLSRFSNVSTTELITIFNLNDLNVCKFFMKSKRNLKEKILYFSVFIIFSFLLDP